MINRQYNNNNRFVSDGCFEPISWGAHATCSWLATRADKGEKMARANRKLAIFNASHTNNNEILPFPPQCD